jgi:branched-chain amino acid transport system substrate-binding protein
MKPEFIRQYQEANFNYPVTEAGYAYDLFQLLHKSLILTLKSNSGYSTQALAEQIKHTAAGTGIMGRFTLNKNGVLYTQSEVKQVKNGQIRTV